MVRDEQGAVGEGEGLEAGGGGEEDGPLGEVEAAGDVEVSEVWEGADSAHLVVMQVAVEAGRVVVEAEALQARGEEVDERGVEVEVFQVQVDEGGHLGEHVSEALGGRVAGVEGEGGEGGEGSEVFERGGAELDVAVVDAEVAEAGEGCGEGGQDALAVCELVWGEVWGGCGEGAGEGGGEGEGGLAGCVVFVAAEGGAGDDVVDVVAEGEVGDRGGDGQVEVADRLPVLEEDGDGDDAGEAAEDAGDAAALEGEEGLLLAEGVDGVAVEAGHVVEAVEFVEAGAGEGEGEGGGIQDAGRGGEGIEDGEELLVGGVQEADGAGLHV